MAGFAAAHGQALRSKCLGTTAYVFVKKARGYFAAGASRNPTIIGTNHSVRVIIAM